MRQPRPGCIDSEIRRPSKSRNPGKSVGAGGQSVGAGAFCFAFILGETVGNPWALVNFDTSQIWDVNFRRMSVESTLQRVPVVGIEPTRPLGHKILSLVSWCYGSTI